MSSSPSPQQQRLHDPEQPAWRRRAKHLLDTSILAGLYVGIGIFLLLPLVAIAYGLGWTNTWRVWGSAMSLSVLIITALAAPAMLIAHGRRIPLPDLLLWLFFVLLGSALLTYSLDFVGQTALRSLLDIGLGVLFLDLARKLYARANTNPTRNKVLGVLFGACSALSIALAVASLGFGVMVNRDVMSVLQIAQLALVAIAEVTRSNHTSADPLSKQPS